MKQILNVTDFLLSLVKHPQSFLHLPKKQCNWTRVDLPGFQANRNECSRK